MVSMCNMNGTSEVVRDYFIAGVLGKRETYRTTSGPYYGNPHRNSYAIYGTYSYQINPKWTSILGLRYSDIKGPCEKSTRIDSSVPIRTSY